MGVRAVAAAIHPPNANHQSRLTRQSHHYLLRRRPPLERVAGATAPARKT
jgi:hypothetical protein